MLWDIDWEWYDEIVTEYDQMIEKQKEEDAFGFFTIDEITVTKEDKFLDDLKLVFFDEIE